MTKKIIFILVLCFAAGHHVLAQHKVIIEPFFEAAFKDKVRFEMKLPYKVKISAKTIKRSEVPAFSFYNFVPRKKRSKVKVALCLSEPENDLAYLLEMYTTVADGTLYKEVNSDIYLIKFFESANSTHYRHAIILKQVSIGTKTYCLELEVSGEQRKLETEMPILLNAFAASTVTH